MSRSEKDGERERLRRHFEIERELADRLRSASKERRRTLYGEVYEELHRRVELVGNRQAQQAQVGLLLELVGPFLGTSSAFLEIGAGGCDLSLAVAPVVERVWAVDAVDPGLTTEAVPPGFAFVRSDRVRGVVPAGAVDVALSCHFVEHLHPDDLPDHLHEVLDLLVPGGAYLVVTPNRIYGPHDISRGFSDRAVGLHLREYSHGELAREMLAAGFGEVRAIGRPGTTPGPGWGRLAVVDAVERVLGAVPAGLRRAALRRAPRRAPFRPLEQVKLVGFKPRGGRS